MDTGTIDGSGYWDIKARQVAAISCAFALGTALVVYQIDAVFVALLLLSIVSLKLVGLKTRHILVLLLWIILGLANAHFRTPAPVFRDISELCSISRGAIQLSGRIVEIRKFNKGNGSSMLVESSFVPRNLHGLLQVIVREPRSAVPAQKDLEKGQEITFAGKLCRLKSSSYGAVQLARKGVFCQMRTSPDRISIFSPMDPRNTGRSIVRGDMVPLPSVPPLPEPRSPLRGTGGGAHREDKSSMFSPDYWRESIVSFHSRSLGRENGTLLSSMVLGDRAVELDEKTIESFRCAGISHILAASGFNLSIVAASIFFLAKYLGNIYCANLFCFLGMLAFVFIAGPSQSVLRAFIMGALVLLTRCFFRSIHLPAALSLTMLLVFLFDPWSAADVGLQLSYFSTAGMILGAANLQSLLSLHCGRLPEWLKSAIAATLVAQVCVLPLQLFYFQELNTYSLLANVVVAPVVPLLTVCGFGSSIIFLIEGMFFKVHMVSGLLDQACHFPLEFVRLTVMGIAELPFAQVKTAKASLPAVIYYYAVVFLFPFLKEKNLKYWSILYLLSLLLLLVTIVAPFLHAPI